MVLAQASELPNPESVVRHAVASEFGEETANAALGLAKTYGLVAASGTTADPLIYAPRVWAGLHAKAPQALTPLDNTQREILLHLVGRVRNSQGYPETLFRNEATQHGAADLVRMAIGIGLVNRTELQMTGGTKRAFLTTHISTLIWRMNMAKTCVTESRYSWTPFETASTSAGKLRVGSAIQRCCLGFARSWPSGPGYSNKHGLYRGGKGRDYSCRTPTIFEQSVFGAKARRHGSQSPRIGVIGNCRTQSSADGSQPHVGWEGFHLY